jgi:hypothetical protein
MQSRKNAFKNSGTVAAHFKNEMLIACRISKIRLKILGYTSEKEFHTNVITT